VTQELIDVVSRLLTRKFQAYFYLELGRINNRNDGEESEERENE